MLPAISRAIATTRVLARPIPASPTAATSRATAALHLSGDNVRLSRPGTPAGATVPYITVDHVQYNNVSPWPTPPDGSGPSLSRVNASGYANDSANWTSSATAGGTPGSSNLTVA